MGITPPPLRNGRKRPIKIFRCRRKYSKAAIYVRSDLSNAGQFGAPQSIKENRGFSHLTVGVQLRLR